MSGASEGAVNVARLQAKDRIIPLPVISGKSAECRRTGRLLAEAEIPLRDLHLLDDVVVKQGSQHARVRAVEVFVRGTVAGLCAEVKALPIDARGAQGRRNTAAKIVEHIGRARAGGQPAYHSHQQKPTHCNTPIEHSEPDADHRSLTLTNPFHAGARAKQNGAGG